MRNDVCSELSSVPEKETVTVCPANEETLNDFWLYPEALLRLEYVATVVEPTFTVSLSYAVEVVVSAESMCSQKVSVAAQPAGMVTDWLIASVCVLPYPSRYALFNTTKAAWNAVSVPAQTGEATCSSGTPSPTASPTGGGGCTSPGNKLGNPGFESGSAPWTATAGVIGAFAGQTAHSGTRFAWMDGYGTTHTDTLQQSVTLPAGCSITLSFWLHIDSAETTTTVQFDRLTVTIGATTVATFSNLNKATGYELRTINVSSFAGQTVTLKFTGTEDSSLQTSFVVDDTALTLS